MKKYLYIIGARGFGRELATQFPLWPGFSERYEIRGFLDDNANALDGLDGYPPVVSSVEDFVPGKNDVFVCGLGVVHWRQKYVDIMLGKGGVFETLVAPSAFVASTARLGMGSLVLGKTCVMADASLGDYALCHGQCIVGHDTVVGNHAVLEYNVFLGGFVQVGERATIHTRATILPHLKIGKDAVVGACSCVVRNVKAGTSVFGNPAKRVEW